MSMITNLQVGGRLSLVKAHQILAGVTLYLLKLDAECHLFPPLLDSYAPHVASAQQYNLYTHVV